MNTRAKKILTSFIAGAVAVSTIAGSATALQATSPGEGLNTVSGGNAVVSDVSISEYRFFPTADDDEKYTSGPWGQAGVSFKPYHAYETDDGGKAYVQANYLRTGDGKVAFCIEPAKSSPSSVKPSDDRVPMEVYSIARKGYPAMSGSDYGVSDIELEWATVVATKAVCGVSTGFDDWAVQPGKEDEAAKVREVAEKLMGFKDETTEYDTFAVDSAAATSALADGSYKIGPYKVLTNLGGETKAELAGAPEGATVVKEDAGWFVTVPEASVTEETNFSLSFTNDAKLVTSTVYVPESEDNQKVYIFDTVDAKEDVTVTLKPEKKPDESTATPSDATTTESTESTTTESTSSSSESTSSSTESTSSSSSTSSTTTDSTTAPTPEPEKKGIIIVNKQDEEGRALEGAEFEVFDKDNKLVATIITDRTGKAQTAEIPQGNYTIKEKKAPAGFIINKEEIKVSLMSDKAIAEVSRTVINKRNSVVIKKVGTDNDNKGLTGAVLEIVDSSRNVVAKEVTDKNGEIVVKGLEPGSYTVRETQAPNGYKKTDKTISFSIDENGKVTGETTLKNEPIIVELKKTDTEKKGLENATIEVRDSSGKIVFTGKTNANGIVEIKHLEAGIYKFKEIEPPAGYQLNDKTFEFKVDEYGKVSGTTTLENKETVVTITKKDKNGNAKLAGAKIAVKNSDGKVVAEGKTDKNGELKIYKLAPGTYVYTEEEAPEGYVRSNEKSTFTINSKGENVELTLYNEKLELSSKSSSTTKKTSTTKTSASANTNSASKNSSGEIIKTGADDTTNSAMPIVFAAGAIIAAGAAVAIKKKKSQAD